MCMWGGGRKGRVVYSVLYCIVQHMHGYKEESVLLYTKYTVPLFLFVNCVCSIFPASRASAFENWIALC